MLRRKIVAVTIFIAVMLSAVQARPEFWLGGGLRYDMNLISSDWKQYFPAYNEGKISFINSGGLAANFAAQNQIMGVRKTADVVEKATWTLAIILFVLCLVATAFTPGKSSVETNNGTQLDPNAIKTTVPVKQAPAMPAAQPVQNPATK